MNSSTFAAQFATPLPRAIRGAAESSTWESFLAEYAPSAGPLRLDRWICTDPERPAGRLGPQARHYQATLMIGDAVDTSTAAASGPVAALTDMLYDHGITVETTAFHQVPAGSATATFIEGCDGVHREWALGLADDPVRSALSAVIACANRLLTAPMSAKLSAGAAG